MIAHCQAVLEPCVDIGSQEVGKYRDGKGAGVEIARVGGYGAGTIFAGHDMGEVGEGADKLPARLGLVGRLEGQPVAERNKGFQSTVLELFDLSLATINLGAHPCIGPLQDVIQNNVGKSRFKRSTG